MNDEVVLIDGHQIICYSLSKNNKGIAKLKYMTTKLGPVIGSSAARQAIAGLQSEVAAGTGHEEPAGRRYIWLKMVIKFLRASKETA